MIFHERTEHIELNFHQVRNVTQDPLITTEHNFTNEELANIFTKTLPRLTFELLLSKLGVREFVQPI